MEIDELADVLEGAIAVLDDVSAERREPRLAAVLAALRACLDAVDAEAGRRDFAE